MRTIDAKINRKVFGKLVLNGRTIELKEPTINQILTRDREAEEVREKLEAIRASSDDQEKVEGSVFRELMIWRIRILEIYIPDVSPEDLRELTQSQLFEALALFGEVPSDSSEEMEEEETKKNDLEESQPGER